MFDQSIKPWRRELRAALIERRVALTADERRRFDAAIEDALYRVLIEANARTAALYWPFKGEFDTRPLIQRLDAADVCVALPEVMAANAPLVFRPWRPGAAVRRGAYGIPVPDTREQAHPEAVVAPLVGFDTAGYRLGYGGGYYDRTLAALDPAPLMIGAGYECARVDTIRPDAHDVPMHRIVTETGIHRPTDGA